MKKISKTIICFLFAALSVSAYAQSLSGRMLFTAQLNGMQNGVNTKATGVATILMSPGMDTACINLSWNGLSGATTGIHIHEGKPGQAGGAINDLSSFISRNQVSTMITGSALSASWIGKLMTNQLYLNIHTTANPNGEIRGQLMPSTDWSFVANIDNMQAGTSSNASGLGVFNLSADKKRMWYQVVVEKLSDTISGIHLHQGKKGMSGGVLVDLGGDVNGDVISGSIAVDSTLYMSLLQGEVYINLHNSSNPNGEIRGQLMPPQSLLAYSWVDGSQAGVSTKAKGVATYSVNMTMDTVWYDIMVTGLSDTITGIHLHYGEMGQSGAVAASLDAGIKGNRIKGYLNGSSVVTKMFLASIFKNALYLNIHTTKNPGGEIRGQVMRLAREGFTISLDQEQNGVTGTMGKGSGYVSVDAQGMNAEVYVVMDNMTTQPSGVHFHAGPKGSSGGVIFDLTGWFMGNATGGSIWGFWENNASNNAFNAAAARMLWNDSVYINAHTTANPGGEIRGQVMMGSGCYTQTSNGIFETVQYNNVQIYPNPTSEVLNIKLPEDIRNGKIEIYDATGRLVITSNYTINNTGIPVASLQPGLYIIKFSDNKNMLTANFVKN